MYACILGKLVEKPVIKNGKLEIAKFANLCFSIEPRYLLCITGDMTRKMQEICNNLDKNF